MKFIISRKVIIHSNFLGSDKNVSPLLNKLADVTLTKCEQLPSSTQIRKRPVVAKQKDWPEKKIKDEMGKIDEKNPEVLAKKIIAQGRNLEKSKSSLLLSPRSKVCTIDTFFNNFQTF